MADGARPPQPAEACENEGLPLDPALESLIDALVERAARRLQARLAEADEEKAA